MGDISDAKKAILGEFAEKLAAAGSVVIFEGPYRVDGEMAPRTAKIELTRDGVAAASEEELSKQLEDARKKKEKTVHLTSPDVRVRQVQVKAFLSIVEQGKCMRLVATPHLPNNHRVVCFADATDATAMAGLGSCEPHATGPDRGGSVGLLQAPAEVRIVIPSAEELLLVAKGGVYAEGIAHTLTAVQKAVAPLAPIAGAAPAAGGGGGGGGAGEAPKEGKMTEGMKGSREKFKEARLVFSWYTNKASYDPKGNWGGLQRMLSNFGDKLKAMPADQKYSFKSQLLEDAIPGFQKGSDTPTALFISAPDGPGGSPPVCFIEPEVWAERVVPKVERALVIVSPYPYGFMTHEKSMYAIHGLLPFMKPEEGAKWLATPGANRYLSALGKEGEVSEVWEPDYTIKEFKATMDTVRTMIVPMLGGFVAQHLSVPEAAADPQQREAHVAVRQYLLLVDWLEDKVVRADRVWASSHHGGRLGDIMPCLMERIMAAAPDKLDSLDMTDLTADKMNIFMSSYKRPTPLSELTKEVPKQQGKQLPQQRMEGPPRDRSRSRDGPHYPSARNGRDRSRSRERGQQQLRGRDRSRSPRGGFRGLCHNCGKQGHRAAECRGDREGRNEWGGRYSRSRSRSRGRDRYRRDEDRGRGDRRDEDRGRGDRRVEDRGRGDRRDEDRERGDRREEDRGRGDNRGRGGNDRGRDGGRDNRQQLGPGAGNRPPQPDGGGAQRRQ